MTSPDPAAGSPPSRGIPATLLSPPPPTGSAAPGPDVSAQLLPRPGQPLKATVLESRPAGHLVLATVEGRLEVVARQPIPPGTPILVLARQTAGGNALVLLPEAEQGAGAVPRPGSPNPPRGDAGAIPTSRAPEIAFQPLRLRAVVQQAVTTGPRVDLAGRPLPPAAIGGRLSLRILAITPPAFGPAGSPAGLSPAPAPPTFNPGPASPLAATSAPPGAAIQFHGQVTSQAADGRPLITTPLGALLLARPANLPPGAGLLLALDGPILAPSATEIGLPRSQSLTWPILSDALTREPVPESVATGPAGPSAPTASPSLPQPGRRLTSSLLFFLSALRAGDLAGWLEAAALAGRDPAKLGALRGRLGQEAGQAARQADQVLGDWRLIPIPLLHEGRIEPLHLLIRQHRRGGGADDEEADATRFLLEVELSVLGELQLDGLTRGRRFDLILRSRRLLSAAIRHDVTEIFENANAVAGTRGQIAFHASSGWSFLAKRLLGGQASESLSV